MAWYSMYRLEDKLYLKRCGFGEYEAHSPAVLSANVSLRSITICHLNAAMTNITCVLRIWRHTLKHNHPVSLHTDRAGEIEKIQK
jgi:hypothetical protein